jgi:hypothetical protein
VEGLVTLTAPAFVYDDGGREAAGFRGDAGDCATRAIAIATGAPYREVYDALAERQAAKGKPRSARNGVARDVWKTYLLEHGWVWTPTMRIGSGCTVHLRADELPGGVLIVQVTRHIVAVVDGVIHDTYDPSRDGTRCVYGYFARAASPCDDDLLSVPQREVVVGPAPPEPTNQPKGAPVATNDTTTADPKAEMQGLFETLIGQVQALAPKTKKVEKAAYVRVDLLLPEDKHKTLAYVNHPTTKSVRVEVPKKGGGGYDVIKVTKASEVDKAVKAVRANHDRIVAAQAS